MNDWQFIPRKLSLCMLCRPTHFGFFFILVYSCSRSSRQNRSVEF